MGKLYAGTSGWAYPQWKPEFYPAKLPAAKFLGYYASRLNSVELNYTFRRFPTEKFLAQLQRDTRVAFEFRHESWFCGEVFDALRGANAALCQAESEKLETPNVQTADFTYFRLRKQSYPATQRAELANQALQLAQAGDVFTYFKHEDTPEGALYAEALLAAASRPRSNPANLAT